MLATAGLGISLAFASGSAALAVDIYLIVVGTLGLLLAIARTIGTLPRERATRLDARPPKPSPQVRPRELTKLEREVGLSTETAFDAYFRLRPTIRQIAATRLRMRGVDLDSSSGTAAELLGPEAWELARADRARPRAHDAKGLSLERIDEIVVALESL